MSASLSQDMQELLQALNRWNAQYLVVGAHAVNAYTEPRSTKDLDIWVNPTSENARLVLAALREFGAPLFGMTEETLAKRGDFLIIGVPPNRIDILKEIPGVEFAHCWENRYTVDLNGTSVPFPGLTDLYAAKLAAGRLQDLADAEKLKVAIKLSKR